MPLTWRLTDADRETFARELEAFVPARVFDAHAHLHRASWWADAPPIVQAGPPEVTLDAYRDHIAWVLPEREVHALHFAYPFPADDPRALPDANAWVADEIAADPHGRGLLVVRPTDDPDWVRDQVRAHGFRGIKPYHFYAAVEPSWEAEVPDYLPEPLMAAADAEGWVVMLHLVRARGIADASNGRWVRRYCERYPRVQVVLAHCARGFSPYHVLEGLPALAGLPNLWLDTSAVCGATSVLAALEVLGPERLLYGSDFCVSHLRGTNIGVGDTFLWFEETSGLQPPAYAPDFALPLVGLESLRALKAACQLARLDDRQVEGVFGGNAAALLAR